MSKLICGVATAEEYNTKYGDLKNEFDVKSDPSLNGPLGNTIANGLGNSLKNYHNDISLACEVSIDPTNELNAEPSMMAAISPTATG